MLIVRKNLSYLIGAIVALIGVSVRDSLLPRPILLAKGTATNVKVFKTSDKELETLEFDIPSGAKPCSGYGSKIVDAKVRITGENLPSVTAGEIYKLNGPFEASECVGNLRLIRLDAEVVDLERVP